MATDYDIEDLDGRDKPYIPGEELDIEGDVSLHTEQRDDIDPITYKVIQHSLWNINQQHGETIENLAVSPITLETRDFQPGIQQADGDFLYFGQYLQYFAGVLDLNVKWILENRSRDPGINPGDMFLNNDPWVGAPHQQDVTIAAPVFHDGKIFCWVANVAHQNDIGGSVPGSFCQNADDIHDDPVPIPPVKIVDEGDIRSDIEEAYRRHSRTPVNLGLDLRAQIAGNNHAREQIKELIQKYGADTVKAVMGQITESSEQSVGDILDDIPDGVWEQRMYQEVAKTGDRGTYEVRMRLEKDGDTLTFDNEGTHPEVGAISLPLAGWRGGILSTVNFMLIPEEMGAVGGVAEHVEFEPEIGTLTAPEYGVATSPAGMYATHTGVAMTSALVSKMLLSSENDALREKAMSTLCSQWAMTILEGENQRGDYFVGPMMDGMFGSGAALPDRDGQFANGVAVIPEGQAPNVELYERDWPILYLYRDEQPDSGGSGYRRGGNNGRLAFVQHKGDITPGVYTNEAIPKSLGIFGGGPGSRMQTRVVRDAGVDETFEEQQIPGTLEELDGEQTHPPGKGSDLTLSDGDVEEWSWQSTAGYGDPLDREPERVAEDVNADRISPPVAEEKYGVVLTDDGEVDADATAKHRQSIRDTRLAESDAEMTSADEAGTRAIADVREADEHTVGDYLRVNDGFFECAKCGHEFGAVDENIKPELACRTQDIEDIGPLWLDASTLVDDEMEHREFFCPSCGTRVSTEVAQRDADHIADVRLRD